jgi:hypothetical protein
MVTLIEYGQVVYGGDAEAEALPAAPLPPRTYPSDPVKKTESRWCSPTDHGSPSKAKKCHLGGSSE